MVYLSLTKVYTVYVHRSLLYKVRRKNPFCLGKVGQVEKRVTKQKGRIDVVWLWLEDEWDASLYLVSFLFFSLQNKQKKKDKINTRMEL